jgi:hypothetical protein
MGRLGNTDLVCAAHVSSMARCQSSSGRRDHACGCPAGLRALARAPLLHRAGRPDHEAWSRKRPRVPCPPAGCLRSRKGRMRVGTEGSGEGCPATSMRTRVSSGAWHSDQARDSLFDQPETSRARRCTSELAPVQCSETGQRDPNQVETATGDPSDEKTHG